MKTTAQRRADLLEALQRRQRWQCDALDLERAHAMRLVMSEQQTMTQLQDKHTLHAARLNQQRLDSMDSAAYQQGLVYLLALQNVLLKTELRLCEATDHHASLQLKSVYQQQRLRLFEQDVQRRQNLQTSLAKQKSARETDSETILRAQRLLAEEGTA